MKYGEKPDFHLDGHALHSRRRIRTNWHRIFRHNGMGALIHFQHK